MTARITGALKRNEFSILEGTEIRFAPGRVSYMISPTCSSTEAGRTAGDKNRLVFIAVHVCPHVTSMQVGISYVCSRKTAVLGRGIPPGELNSALS